MVCSLIEWARTLSAGAPFCGGGRSLESRRLASPKLPLSRDTVTARVAPAQDDEDGDDAHALRLLNTPALEEETIPRPHVSDTMLFPVARLPGQLYPLPAPGREPRPQPGPVGKKWKFLKDGNLL